MLTSEFVMVGSLIRRYGPLAFWLVVFGLVGWAIGGFMGAFLGILLAALWAIFALAGADRYGIALHDGRLLSRIEAPNLHDIIDELAGEAQVDVPSLYALPFNEPNLIVCASAYPGGVRSRIGVTNGITAALDREDVRAMLALAVSRIASGEASIVSVAAAAAGLPLQLAHSSFVNTTAGNWLRIDPDCGLTPIGKAALAVAAPFAWTTNMVALTWWGCLRADRAAARFLGSADDLAGALESLANAIPSPDTGAGAGFNPGTAPMFVVSPFEGAHGMVVNEAARPWWRRLRIWVAGQTPPAAERAGALRRSTLPNYEPAPRRDDGPAPTAEHVTWPP